MPARPISLPNFPRVVRLPRLRRPSLSLVVLLLVVVAALAAGWLWLRDSSLVRVDQISVTGATGLSAPAVRSALTSEAGQMTTLNVDRAALDQTAARFPLVKSLTVTTKFPHKMSIVVHERTAVGALVTAGESVAVAGDGMILRGVPVAGLPLIEVSRVSTGSRVADRTAASEVRLLSLAPARLRSDITQVVASADGLTVSLRSGPQLRFGDAQRLRAKWVAANRVLRDPQAAGAGYIDLSIPERPASGQITAAADATNVAPTQDEGASP